MEEAAPNLDSPGVGEIIGGKYRIERLIGQGGMGAVYAATHEVTGKAVAVKWLLAEATADPHADERFLREARAAGRIRHPNVVDVYDVGRDERGAFMVMELLEGETLGRVVARGPVHPRVLVGWLLPAIRGLAAAHRSGVIHRDLKPDNIFLAAQPDGGSPIPKVLDFGISKVTTGADDELTRSGTVMGTPRYMPAEQFKGAKNLDHRVDIYAIGVILYRGLTGRLPFTGESYGAMAIAVATAEVVPPREIVPSLDPTLEAIVLRAMAREPHQRFSSMDELAEHLLPFADTTGSMPAPAPPVAPLPAPSPAFARTVIQPIEAAPPPAPSVPPSEAIPSGSSPAAKSPWRVAIAAATGAGGLVGVALVAWLAMRAGVEPETTERARGTAAAPAQAPVPAAPNTALAPAPAAPNTALAPAPAAPNTALAAPSAARPPVAEAPAAESAEAAPVPAPEAEPASALDDDTDDVRARRRLRPARGREPRGERAAPAREPETRSARGRRTGSISLDDF